MNSPIPWLGGKSRLADQIIKILPTHDHYAEAFTGAGWIYFRKPLAKSESLNDINGDLIAFYRVLQSHLEEFCKQFKWLLASREMFTDFRRQQTAGGLTDIQRAARFYYLQRLAFGGRQGGVFGVDKTSQPRINLVRMEEELSQVHLRLTHTIIENLPWQDYVARYDGPSTFFYLDPPYYGCEKDYGRDIFSRDDFAHLAEVLGQIKGKFLLSINDVPEIREAFKAFGVREVETTYSVQQEGSQKVQELLFMNYTPDRGLLKYL
ncbi:MAG: DNA adenine methylase [Proteobacteria bacterium]|nr:DNA adenine methylase [Pseudomonadota bacterium]